MQTIITLVLAVAAYLGYYSFADLTQRAWAYYVATGVLMAWLAWERRQTATTGPAAFVATYILIESAQQAFFGALAWGSLPTGQDLAVQLGFEPVYVAATSLLLAGVWTWRRSLWPSRQAPR